MEQDHVECDSIRQKVKGIGEHGACRQVMSFLFELADEFTLGRRTMASSSATPPTAATAGADDNSDSDDEKMAADQHEWVRFRTRQLVIIQEQVDSFLEVASFCLVEPLALGFFPFQTEVVGEAIPRSTPEVAESNDGSTVDGAQTTAPHRQEEPLSDVVDAEPMGVDVGTNSARSHTVKRPDDEMVSDETVMPQENKTGMTTTGVIDGSSTHAASSAEQNRSIHSSNEPEKSIASRCTAVSMNSTDSEVHAAVPNLAS